MAQTPAQQKAALQAQLKAAQAAIAQTKKTIATVSAIPTPPRTPARTDAQMDRDLAAATADAAAKKKAKDDAEANAAATAASINAMGITGLSSKVNPTTGMVETTKPAKIASTKVEDIPGDEVVSVYTDEITGDVYQVWKSGKKTLMSKGTKAADAEAAANKARYDAEQAALVKKAQDEAAKRDAFATIQDTMRSYGFTDAEMSEISGFIEKSIIDPNIGPQMAILQMRNLGAYKKRFSANDTLVKAGKNALSEYDYLQQENAYDEYFKAYGVGNLSTREQKATLIGNSVSALEVDKRLNLAVKRVQNSDPEILKQLKAYYPSINDKDLVSYFLNPDATRVDLERKVTASEIGSAAIGQGFKGTSLSALDLADYGVDRGMALEGYANVASVLPEATKFGDIYGETKIKYDQKTGEEEFLKSSSEAKRKRNVLASKERASFEGTSGMNKVSLNQSISI
jgi:hypothetical protein